MILKRPENTYNYNNNNQNKPQQKQQKFVLQAVGPSKPHAKETDEIIFQKYRGNTQAKFSSKARSYVDTDEHCQTEGITDVHVKVPGKNHRDVLEVKVSGGADICMLPLRAYRRMFPNNFTADGLSKA